MTYSFLLSDNTTFLPDVLPLESNGAGAQSVPRAILDIDFFNNAFIVSDDLSSRFVAGFSFDVLAGPYTATYIVLGSATYDGPSNTTSIPVTTPIVAQPFAIVDVTTGLNGVWEISGANNGDCVYYPGSSFTVAGNSDGPSNGAYTVLSSDVSGSYSIAAVTPGPGGVGTSWTVTGFAGVAEFFNVGEQFKITGASNPGAGTYTIVSAVLSGPNTEVTVVEAIPVTANILGLATPVPAVTRITVTGVIPGTAASDGTATSPPSVAYTFAFAPTMLTLVGPNTYTIIWHVAGNFASRFVVGCPLIIKDNSTFDGTTMTVLSAVDVGPNTEVTVQFRYPSFPTLPDATGTLTYPLPPIPYGFIQYDIPTAATSLKLVGRGSPAFNNNITWGHALQENDLHLLENFNSFLPPAAPLQGQMWFNQGTSSLFLFTSTIYDIFAVVPGLGLWTLDGSHGDVTAVFVPGLKFAVYNNAGLNLAGSPLLVFQVSSSFFNGTETEITINAAPNAAPPFTVAVGAIPAVADDLTPYGQLYTATEWNEVALSSDLHALDVKASVRFATVAALPAYTAAGAGFGKTLTANVNGFFSIDGYTYTALDSNGERVLIKDQAVAHADHGIYVITDRGSAGTPWILTRAPDVDGAPGSEVSAGMFMWVNEGVTNNDTGWVLVTADPIVVDTTALQFTKFAIYAPGGLDTHVQFNDGGVFGGDADFTWNKTTNVLAINGTISNAVGSAAAPSYTFTGDLNTGLYNSAADRVSVAIAGAEKVRFDAAGVTVFSSFIGTAGLAAAPTYTFSGDTDTGIYSSALDTVNITTASVLRLTVAAAGITSTVPVIHPAGTAPLPSITFTGDTTTGIYNTPATVNITTAGALRFTFGSAGHTSTVPVLHPLGTAALPSITFTGDTNTGLYNSAADEVSLAAGGTQRVAVGTSIIASAGSFLRINTNSVERLEITSTGEWEVGGSPGTAEQVIASNGAGTPPTWQSVANLINEPANRIVYGTGTGITSDADLTYINTTGAFYVNTINGTSGSLLVAAPGTVGLFGAKASVAAVAGGAINIIAGPSATLAGAGNGGAINIAGGSADVSPGVAGGNVTVAGGANSATGGAGGTMTLSGAPAAAGVGAGGAVTVSGGAGGGAGGALILQGGAGVNANGGAVSISGNTPTGSAANGGNVSITSGNATSTGAAGNVSITAGSSPSGTDGSIVFTTNSTERFEILGDGGWEVGGSQGTAEQVLASNGAGTPPTWQSVANLINEPANQIVYGTGTSITSESDFTWNPTTNVLAINGTISNAIGSAAAPSYTFTGDTDTGIYDTADAVNITTGGVLRFTFGSAGHTSTVPLAMSANKITGVASGTVSGDVLQFGQIGAQIQTWDLGLDELAALATDGNVRRTAGVFVVGAIDLTADVTGTLPIGNGGTGQVTATAAFDALDPLTTKGDIIVHDGTNSVRLPVGTTDGQIIVVNSADAEGIEWRTYFLKGSLAFTFGAIAADSTGASTNTLTVTGAVAGDIVSLGLPTTGGAAGFMYSGYVSAVDTVTIRAANSGGATGAGAADTTIQVVVTKYANVL